MSNLFISPNPAFQGSNLFPRETKNQSASIPTTPTQRDHFEPLARKEKTDFFFSPEGVNLVNDLQEDLNTPLNSSYLARQSGSTNQKRLQDIIDLATGKLEEVFAPGNNALKGVFSTGIPLAFDVSGREYPNVTYPDQLSDLYTTKINNDFIVQSIQEWKNYYEQLFVFITNVGEEGIRNLIRESMPEIDEADLARLSDELFTGIQENARLLSSNIQIFNQKADEIQGYLNRSSNLNQSRKQQIDQKFDQIAQNFAGGGGGGGIG